MKIFIDGVQADMDDTANVKISLGIAAIATPEKRKTGYSRPIRLPMTAHNDALMGYCSEINSPTAFNKASHAARIEHEGCVVMEGPVQLLECVKSEGGAGYYSLAMTGAGKEWVAKAAATPLRTAEIEFRETISAAMIAQSWTWEKPVRFLPVGREDFRVENYNSHLFPPVKILSFEDYHPFLNVKSITKAIFAAAGYSIASQFMDEELFNSLYMSGNYPSRSTEREKTRMNFLAGRFEQAQTSANSLGRIYADPLSNLNTINNLVDTADPKEENADGVTLEKVFNTNDCFRKIGDRIAFVPTEAVSVGFEFSVQYTADYYLVNREELETFNRLYLWEGQVRNYKVANRNEDRRAEFRAGKTFMAIVFDHMPGDSYELRYDEVTNQQADMDNLTPTDITAKVYGTFTTRTQSVTVVSANPVVNPSMWIKISGSNSYVPCAKDWALYDGYVRENGEVEVEMKVRSSPENVTPGKPKYFDQIYFGGARPGMKFTLGRNTTIRPLFAGYPCEGSTVKFEDVAAHEVSCMDMINSIKHMFNLYFFTDNLSKTVYIEPRDEFYKEEEIIDWSDRIDLSLPIKIEEAGAAIPFTYSLGYRTGDGAVTQHNMVGNGKFGSYSWVTGNMALSEIESVYENPLFTASINSAGDYPDAPAASIVQAGTRGTDDADNGETLNFPAKIVSYRGMTALPGSQLWGWPSNQGSYPMLAFHHAGNEAGKGFSLCFEDRDGIAGLHTLYDRTLDIWSQSKRVELNLRLGAEDVEPFISPNRLARDFRGLFRLSIGGENALYRLEEICDYDPAKASTKCVFIKEI